MGIRFIHTADWHIGKRFGRFDPDKAALLRDARARIVDRVAELARQEDARIVLVAGDVFDGPGLADASLRRLTARLAAHDDIDWHFLPGNHDPDEVNGIWQRFVGFLGTARHVSVSRQPVAVELSDDAVLLPAPLHARALAHDPTAWMDGCRTADGVIRVGLAHGSVKGFGSGGDASIPLSLDRAARAGLNYLALGDWHGVSEVAPRTWYSGTPEPDQFPDNEPGYALCVEIPDAGSVPVVTQHRLAHFNWRHITLDAEVLGQGGDELEASVCNPAGCGDRTLLHLSLRGRVSLEQELELRRQLDGLEDRVFHLERSLKHLTVDFEASRDAHLFDDPMLKSVADRLQARIAAGEGDAPTAHQALLMLATFASQVDGRSLRPEDGAP